MSGLTETEAAYAAGGAVLGGAFATIAIFAIVYEVLLIIACWKIFTKAGEAGWKSIIPFYNMYILVKISKLSVVWFLINLVCSICMSITQVQWLALIGLIGYIVSEIVIYVKLADAFGKGTGFKVGLVLLPTIFTLILGFGNAEYQK